MTLLEQQRQMREWLRKSIQPTAHREPRSESGLNVYQNNYRAQLVACLEETFARVKAWIGDEAFQAAAAQHIDEHSPCHWTLDAYGAEFPETLRAVYPRDPGIAEIAWLDRALSDAFVGRDAAPFTPASAGDIDWDRTCLQFVPSLRIADFRTNATAIWSALSAATPPPRVIFNSNSSAVIVWRKAFTSCFREVAEDERAAIAHFQQGGTFGELCMLLIERHGETAGLNAAAALLAQWFKDELIAEISEKINAPKDSMADH